MRSLVIILGDEHVIRAAPEVRQGVISNGRVPECRDRIIGTGDSIGRRHFHATPGGVVFIPKGMNVA